MAHRLFIFPATNLEGERYEDQDFRSMLETLVARLFLAALAALFGALLALPVAVSAVISLWFLTWLVHTSVTRIRAIIAVSDELAMRNTIATWQVIQSGAQTNGDEALSTADKLMLDASTINSSRLRAEFGSPVSRFVKAALGFLAESAILISIVLMSQQLLGPMI